MIFEDGDNGKGELQKILSEQGYPDPIFRPKRDRVHRKSGIITKAVIPLQAADLLAYELFRLVRDYVQGKSQHNYGEVMRFKNGDLEKIPGMCGMVSDDHLKFLKEGLKQMTSPIFVPPVRITGLR
jgi:hypothetical protein